MEEPLINNIKIWGLLLQMQLVCSGFMFLFSNYLDVLQVDDCVWNQAQGGG